MMFYKLAAEFGFPPQPGETLAEYCARIKPILPIMETLPLTPPPLPTTRPPPLPPIPVPQPMPAAGETKVLKTFGGVEALHARLAGEGEMNKESWFDSKFLNPSERNVCRCILKMMAKNLYQPKGKTVYSPYAICINSIGGKGEENRAKRLALHQMVTAGECGQHINPSQLPTPHLYAWANERRRQFRNFPSLEVFAENPERWRQSLLNDIALYKSK